jgi:thioesterase domain-containing protein
VDSVRHFLHLFRANYEALVKYEPSRSESSAVFFHATEHDSFNPNGFEHAWAPFFGQLELVGIPGNHTTMNLPPNCDGMVRRIETILNHKGTPA